MDVLEAHKFPELWKRWASVSHPPKWTTYIASSVGGKNEYKLLVTLNYNVSYWYRTCWTEHFKVIFLCKVNDITEKSIDNFNEDYHLCTRAFHDQIMIYIFYIACISKVLAKCFMMSFKIIMKKWNILKKLISLFEFIYCHFWLQLLIISSIIHFVQNYLLTFYLCFKIIIWKNNSVSSLIN